VQLIVENDDEMFMKFLNFTRNVSCISEEQLVCGKLDVTTTTTTTTTTTNTATTTTVCVAGSHDQSLVHEIISLSQWCSKFTTSVPTQLITYFKSQLSPTAKLSSSVCTAFVNCMTATFTGPTPVVVCSSVCVLKCQKLNRQWFLRSTLAFVDVFYRS